MNLNPFLDKAKNYMSENPEGLAAGVGGLVGLATNLFGNSQVEKDEKGNGMATDVYGRPVYSTAGYMNSIDLLEDQAKKSIGSSMVSGVTSGIAAGSMLGPYGAAIGAGAGAVAGLIGGKRRKNQIKDEVRNREQKLKESVNRFNVSNKNYFEEAMTADVNEFMLARRAQRLG